VDESGTVVWMNLSSGDSLVNDSARNTFTHSNWRLKSKFSADLGRAFLFKRNELLMVQAFGGTSDVLEFAGPVLDVISSRDGKELPVLTAGSLFRFIWIQGQYEQVGSRKFAGGENFNRLRGTVEEGLFLLGRTNETRWNWFQRRGKLVDNLNYSDFRDETFVDVQVLENGSFIGLKTDGNLIRLASPKPISDFVE